MPAITPPAEDALRALSGYVHRVAAALGVGPESTWCEVADRPSAYVALDEHPPNRTHHDLALLWDARHGWSAVAEGDDLVVLARLDGDLRPDPADVVAFTRRVLAGELGG